MVRFALAATSGITRWATSPFTLPVLRDGASRDGAGCGAGVTEGDGAVAAEGAGWAGCDRVSTTTINATATAMAATIAARRVFEGTPRRDACAPMSAGATWSISLAGSCSDGEGFSKVR